MARPPRRYSLWFSPHQDFRVLHCVGRAMSFKNAGYQALRLTGHLTGRGRAGALLFAGRKRSSDIIGWTKPAPDLWLLRGPRGLAVIELPSN